MKNNGIIIHKALVRMQAWQQGQNKLLQQDCYKA